MSGPNSQSVQGVSCILCGSDDATLIHWGQDRLLNHLGRFPIVKCNQCGLIRQSPRPVDMAQFYTGGYPSFHDEPGQASTITSDDHAASSLPKTQKIDGRAGLYFQSLRQAVTNYSGTLLDVGCADGSFMLAMSRLGFDVSGIEVDAQAAAAANRRFVNTGRQPVRATELTDAHYPNQAFDIITAWHVIEHLADPLAFLCEVRRILKPGGLCLIQTPRADSPAASIFGQYWAGWESPRHLWLFTASTLGQLSQQAGLQIQRQLNAPSYGILLLSLRFLLNAKSRDRLGDKFYAVCQKSLPDKLFYNALIPIDALGFGSQLTLCLIATS